MTRHPSQPSREKDIFNKTSLLKKEATPGDEYYVTIPHLVPNQVIVPDTMNLTFKFKNNNTKSWFKSSLGQLLCEALNVRGGGELFAIMYWKGFLKHTKTSGKATTNELVC